MFTLPASAELKSLSLKMKVLINPARNKELRKRKMDNNSPTRPYNLDTQDTQMVASLIAQEVILKGSSTGWQESEPGEEAEIADILVFYNIHPSQEEPGTWEFRPDRLVLHIDDLIARGQLPAQDLGHIVSSLNQMASTTQGLVEQINIAYTTAVVIQRVEEDAATSSEHFDGWFRGVCDQVTRNIQVIPFQAERLVRLALYRLAEIPEAEGMYELIQPDPTLVLQVRQQLKRNGQNRHIYPMEKLEGYFTGLINGVERCLHITFEDEATIVLDIFDHLKAAESSEVGELISLPIIINLQTGTTRLEPPLNGHEPQEALSGDGEGI